MAKSDLENWKRANNLRLTILAKLKETGGDYTPQIWTDNPIFNFCNTSGGLDELGFKIIEIPEIFWKEWEGFDDGYKSEVAIIIANPQESAKCLSDIHYHEGDVIITGLGETYGFKNPQTTFFRGKLEANTFLDKSSVVTLDAYPFGDNTIIPIQSLEPHGTFVKPNTVTVFLAVTCGQRFNNDGDVDATKIKPERCVVSGLHQQSSSLIEYIKVLS